MQRMVLCMLALLVGACAEKKVPEAPWEVLDRVTERTCTGIPRRDSLRPRAPQHLSKLSAYPELFVKIPPSTHRADSAGELDLVVCAASMHRERKTVCPYVKVGGGPGDPAEIPLFIDSLRLRMIDPRAQQVVAETTILTDANCGDKFMLRGNDELRGVLPDTVFTCWLYSVLNDSTGLSPEYRSACARPRASKRHQ